MQGTQERSTMLHMLQARTPNAQMHGLQMHAMAAMKQKPHCASLSMIFFLRCTFSFSFFTIF
jgi:hypothetical protein